MKNLSKSIALTIIGMLILFQSLSLAFQNNRQPGAKALFYDPRTGTVLGSEEKKKKSHTGMTKVKRIQSDQARYVGVHYWIELDGIGPVTADRVFHTGERIRLHIRSNVAGYLSLWSLDSSGYGKQLFPQPGQAEVDNSINADSEYVTPGKIKFSPPAEDERLLVFFSRSKADMPAPTATRPDSSFIAGMQRSAGSKSLLFETESNSSAEVGSYVVNKDGGLIVKEIRLRHQ